ncbi:bifunctional 4-hydroxy-2-oxoglutarate aldolase/2-dehydro-3-deoxy-phosphogluconate aldolase [Streptomyces iconiensis]|uniref:Bifunctional 4-hydroxy-2-oxoglutarate aldolase/2-dehydro-3-deoxy-phosphogluconate aldolase n=1 Tax=Streptomyces iconiensis TaxID=1384038 RepID=A0ABT6ZY78_9ACTN|nr:bifunctional 4-hydroxy-2-oxoglutarate aldolase/2-dehydro-3-deoxy-phosphogluconate aldolase [Streptomyces iconiensis]MDJ1133764.1 bifunctional 4-hydroxy-2-oxoglutarate aldolase/2-dehydro-3-deoxy-phosphogluconate aldolase [Streptomyces iconiensis]
MTARHTDHAGTGTSSPDPTDAALGPAVRSVVGHLERARIVPTVRAADAEAADALARTLLAAGISTFEFTATTPGWEDLVAAWARDEPGATVGLGTVTSATVAESALAAGAAFLVSPFQVPEVRPVADAADRLFVEGGLSPTELRASAQRGVAKLFPAHVGGLPYLKSLLSVMPGARIMATGGVTLANAGEWLAAGAFTVSIGSDLTASGDIPAAVERLRAHLDTAGPTATADTSG